MRFTDGADDGRSLDDPVVVSQEPAPAPSALTDPEALRELLGGWVLGAGEACSGQRIVIPVIPERAEVTVPAAPEAIAVTSVTPIGLPAYAGLLGQWVTKSAPASHPSQYFGATEAESSTQAVARINVPQSRSALPRSRQTLPVRVRPLHQHPTPSAGIERRRRELTAKLDDAIAAMGAYRDAELAAALRALNRLRAGLSRPARLIIAGSINSGKSSLANQLLGTRLVPTSLQRNSYIPTLLRYSERPVATGVGEDGSVSILTSGNADATCDVCALTLGVPSARLKSLEILDLPGLDQGSVGGLEAKDLHGDMLIWCTPSSSPWGEQERMFWQARPPWLKSRSLLVVTHPDLLTKTRQTERLLRRVYGEAESEFRDILLMSAVAPSDRGKRRLSHWLRQLAREAHFRRVESTARVASRISDRVQERLAC